MSLLKGKVSFWTALGYKGGGPMWAWILHRISGLSMIIFVAIHVYAGFTTQQLTSGWGVWYNTLYENVWFQLYIVFCVIFHAVNGLRIVIQDTWPKLIPFEHEAIWLEWLVILPVYGLTAFVMVQHAMR